MTDEVTQHPQRGRLLILAATLLWSTSGFFAKAPVIESLAPEDRGLQLAFWRALFACLALFPFIRRPTWTWRLLPAVVWFAAMNTTFLLAMTTTTEANAIWLQYTAPLWVFAVGVGLWGEPSTRGDYFMLVLGATGVATILFFELSHARQTGAPSQGIGWGVAAGVCFAGVILSIRALRDLESFWIIAVCHLGAAVVLAPRVLFEAQHTDGLTVGPLSLPSSTALAWLALFGILQMGVPYVLFAVGTRSVPGHEASFIALLEPILVPAWVWLVWRQTAGYEPPAWWTLVGGSLILAGLTLKYASDLGRRLAKTRRKG
jgi:drug/metabolite transporter (DMT)-like permease